MPIALSDFTRVGFSIDTGNATALTQTTAAIMPDCHNVPLSDGLFACVIKDDSGAELRVVLQKTAAGGTQIVTMNPGFVGQGRTEFEIAADVSDPEYKTSEITLTAHFAGDQAPIVFELADPLDAAKVKPGANVAIDIAAFGDDVQIFPDEKTYYASQRPSGHAPVFAANFFVPSGMFLESKGGAMPNDATRPVPRADFAGTVLSAQLKSNNLGKGQFWSAAVRTYDGATFDVVLDPRQVDSPLKPGEIISGRFWLSAHLAP
jgi:hypothetical protein